ncbi:probable addiction module antidote protein [Rhizobiales bacterium GAS191]|jgi:probable addiction module antidote protein|nr:probable addiction module antidote protein [Rhizobiales bacterium GAS113]SED71587.1 probable addiction module antidote protein [Rhizobiales bacterium GAS188]SEE81500.1 probable addiction module antidote protein [Rhizobiales bacterium GAS191]
MAKTTIKTTRWDPAARLTTKKAIAGYLEAALEEGDPALIVAALGDIARSRGMSQVAKDARLTRASLYKSLRSESNPEFATILKVMGALGVRLKVEPIPEAA